MDREKLTIFFAIAVLAVWIMVVLAAILTKDYTVLTAITPVMLIVTGFLFGYRSKANGNGG